MNNNVELSNRSDGKKSCVSDIQYVARSRIREWDQ